MWAYESVFYQIYPLGFCGAPFENDGVPEHRILKVNDWIPHIEKLGANAIYFSPVFESDITPKLIPVSARMRTFNLSVKTFTKQGSRLF